jgi:uncharacterized protein YifN (PemK superfamily)
MKILSILTNHVKMKAFYSKRTKWTICLKTPLSFIDRIFINAFILTWLVRRRFQIYHNILKELRENYNEKDYKQNLLLTNHVKMKAFYSKRTKWTICLKTPLSFIDRLIFYETTLFPLNTSMSSRLSF